MALVNCPECNKEVSEKARVCPNCGYPLLKNRVKLSENRKKMFSKKTKIGIIITITAILTCIIIAYEFDTSNRVDYMTRNCEMYLESKYDSNFSLKEIVDKDRNSIEAHFVCDSFPDYVIYATCEKDKKDDYKYEDNYMMYYYKNKTIEEMTRVANEIYKSFKIIYKIPDVTSFKDYGYDTTFETFISDGNTFIPIEVFLDETNSTETKDTDIIKLQNALMQKNYNVMCSVNYVNNEIYSKITDKTYGNINISKGVYTYATIWIDTFAKSSDKIEWKQY